MESKNYFKENLKMLRKEEGLSQDKLALLLETSRSTISFWENGEREPTMSSLIKLSKFFKVSIDYLVGLEK
ncbi:MAG: helix-turn-helix transcriptional regulator [Clostridia bacterium]|nr:helix-turn-helix transcriptional regulator [Clostridia bacterium]